MLLFLSSVLHFLVVDSVWVLPDTIPSEEIIGTFAHNVVRAIRLARSRLPGVSPYVSNADMQEDQQAAEQQEAETGVPTSVEFIFNRMPTLRLADTLQVEYNYFGLDSWASPTLRSSVPFRVTLAMFRHCGLTSESAN
ncbi:unnamed protein product [Mucor hiemalis]